MSKISIYSLKLIKESTAEYNVPQKVDSPQNTYDLFNNVLDISSNAEEVLAMATLDTKLHVSGVFIVSRGTVNCSMVHPREVFKRAILQNASCIVLAHNHPSGDSTPSEEDIKVTKRLKECGELIGIDLLDHLVIGDEEYTSMKEKHVI